MLCYGTYASIGWQAPAIITSVVVLIFGGYEIFERIWLGQADPELLRRLHILRGIGATVAGSVLLAWRLNSRTRQMLPPESAALFGPDGIGEQIAWFLAMRWLAAAVTTITVFISQHILQLLPEEVTPYLWLGSAALWATSAVFSRTRTEFGNMRPYLLWLIVTDLIILTHLLHFSGGLENQLYVIYTFHVIIAGILLPRKAACWVSALVAAFFLGIAFGEYFHILPHYTLAIFPHAAHGAEISHASHQLPFVLAKAGAFLLLLGGATFFTTTIMERLKAGNQRLLETEKLGALGQLVAYIAHEVNNPIGIISTRMKLARSGAGEYTSAQFLKETLEIVDRQADRVAGVVKSLLGLSKPHLQPRSSVSLNEILSEALYILSGRSSRTGVAVRESFMENLPKIESRSNDLLHIFLNILNNAIDAMPDGGVLRVETTVLDGWVCAGISDTGPGIPEDLLDKVFDPFFTTKARELGTGLGLSVSQALTRSLGGNIKIESRPGKGSAFHIRFPLKAGS